MEFSGFITSSYLVLRYENTVTILKPSCRILAMMYHGREPGKIWWVSDLFEQVLFVLFCFFLSKLCFLTKPRDLRCDLFLCDVATCGMTHLPRSWRWQTSTLVVKSWCSRRAPAWCWAPSWKGWAVWRESCELFTAVHPFDWLQWSFSVMSAPFFFFVIALSFLPVQAMAQWSKCTLERSRFGPAWRALASLHIFTTRCMSSPSAASMLCWQELWTQQRNH